MSMKPTTRQAEFMMYISRLRNDGKPRIRWISESGLWSCEDYEDMEGIRRALGGTPYKAFREHYLRFKAGKICLDRDGI